MILCVRRKSDVLPFNVGFEFVQSLQENLLRQEKGKAKQLKLLRLSEIQQRNMTQSLPELEGQLEAVSLKVEEVRRKE